MKPEPTKEQRKDALFEALDGEIMMLEAEVRRRISNIRKVEEELIKLHEDFWKDETFIKEP